MNQSKDAYHTALDRLFETLENEHAEKHGPITLVFHRGREGAGYVTARTLVTRYIFGQAEVK